MKIYKIRNLWNFEFFKLYNFKNVLYFEIEQCNEFDDF